MSKIEVNAVEPQCGTTLTLGASGDTVTLGSGASQSGFGRTGTVDWQTTKKTANFTAVNGEGYFVDTTSAAITVTLPASPSAGNIVAVADYAGTAATNNITVARNGSNFEGGTENGGIATNRQSATFVYVDGTQGWVVVNSNDASFVLPTYITATGGTVTTCGNFKIHKFTGPGTFCVSAVGNPLGSTTVDYLVVAGGGAGGNDGGYGAGGGAGGFRESSGTASGCYTTSPLGSCVSALPVSAQGYPITVGGGGAGTPPNSGARGSNGSNSVFSTITSAAGGGGGSGASPSPISCAPGANGGSGGGAGGFGPGTKNGGTGNTPPVTPAQGKDGGDATSPGGGYSSGGGGGATTAGASVTNPGPAGPLGGNGGTGATTLISGSSTAYAGGGGGGGWCAAGGSGGTGGGGGGSRNNAATPAAEDGTANTGGGGGGGSKSYPVSCASGAGGSGVVIIRYKFQ